MIWWEKKKRLGTFFHGGAPLSRWPTGKCREDGNSYKCFSTYNGLVSILSQVEVAGPCTDYGSGRPPGTYAEKLHILGSFTQILLQSWSDNANAQTFLPVSPVWPCCYHMLLPTERDIQFTDDVHCSLQVQLTMMKLIVSECLSIK